MNPIEVIDKLIENKTDLMDVFGEDYKAMTETIQEMFEFNGYRLIVEQLKQ
ncbi:hypothetical protein [Romboutsia sp. Marseille-P6047]|uniref:hypothetical protein n=1 Tax=Romboutsia sp. Marseille-P6047 TaxID=2161817 RepID=UPI0013DDCD4C|nr:hypothetical protein [Romboutsia sp. Marseille-P6047]